MRVDGADPEPLVLVERRGRVGIVTINRPEVRNAVSPATSEALADAFDELEGDDDVWVLVLTGAGPDSFCAGADLKALRDAQAAGPAAVRGTGTARGGFAGAVGRTFVKPLIAAVNGTALGGGLELCMVCDLIVAEEHARFGLPEVRRGLVAGAGGLQRLPRRIPPNVALEMILTGEPIDAHRAYELGLVNRVVGTGSGLDEALAIAERILEGAPLAVRYSKAVARATFSLGEDDAVALHREQKTLLMASEDAAEGPRAFVEKRPPTWKGR